MPEHRWIPYGPLTEEDFEWLASSFYDASRFEAQSRAEARGIRPGELIGKRIGEMLAKAELERVRIENE